MSGHRLAGSDLHEGDAFSGRDISLVATSNELDALGFFWPCPMVLTGFMRKEAGSGVRPRQPQAPKGQYAGESERVQEMVQSLVSRETRVTRAWQNLAEMPSSAQVFWGQRFIRQAGSPWMRHVQAGACAQPALPASHV